MFSGENALSSLAGNPGAWSVSALVLLTVLKGLASVFPALFLGAAAGLVAAKLPGFSVTPGVAVGMGAAVAAALRLPLSAVVIATVLTSQAGVGASPLIIVGVVLAYLTTELLSGPREPETTTEAEKDAPERPATVAASSA